jgi:hypothetical protein
VNRRFDDFQVRRQEGNFLGRFLFLVQFMARPPTLAKNREIPCQQVSVCGGELREWHPDTSLSCSCIAC